MTKIPKSLVRFLLGMLAVLLAATIWARGESGDQSQGVTVWHAMGGRNGELLNTIKDDFNQLDPNSQVNLVYKGNYVETMNAGISAFRAGTAPQILMVFDVGTQLMIDSGAITPVSEVIRDGGETLDLDIFLPPVSGYYSDGSTLYSMPFNSSTPVLFYNKDAFRQAGLDPEVAPRTWEEVKQAAEAIVAAGFPGGFTVSWPSWTMVENFGAWHGVPVASNNNGYDGNDSGLKMEVDKEPYVRMLDSLYQWSSNSAFIYGGRRNESEKLFPSGQVAMIITSSAAYTSYSQADFDLGLAELPYWGDVSTAPQNTIIGGASLWVFSGRSAAQKKTIAKFFKYLVSPKVQKEWHQATGYVPVTRTAYEELKEEGFYQQNPGLEIAIQQLNKTPKPFTRGIRIGNLPQIRDVFYAELEDVVTGKKDAQAALSDYVAQAQKIIDEFVASSGK